MCSFAVTSTCCWLALTSTLCSASRRMSFFCACSSIGPWWVIWRSSPPWANRPMSLPALITTFCPAVTCWFCRATLSTCSPAARVRLAGVAAAIPAGPLKAIAGLPPLLLPDSSLAPWPRSRTASWRVCCGAASCPTPWCSPA
ncbi:Uncharacterised protein [Acinetobacter baumannii]|nr:Uncharacterised protein [Acinetobacter baumannii]